MIEKKKKTYTEAQKRATYKYRDTHRADYNENARNSYKKRMENEEAKKIHDLRCSIKYEETQLRNKHIADVEDMLLTLLKQEKNENENINSVKNI